MLKIPIQELRSPPGEEPINDPRVYLAAERTFLSWTRTGIGVMGFGFIVARFTRGVSSPPFGLSAWCGAALVLVGVTMNAAAIRHYLRLIRQLKEGRAELSKSATMAIGLAATLALIGLLVALDLVMSS
jgi:putative membrane protein